MKLVKSETKQTLSLLKMLTKEMSFIPTAKRSFIHDEHWKCRTA